MKKSIPKTTTNHIVKSVVERKNDPSNAYEQFPMDEKSQDVCTLNSTRGIFQSHSLSTRTENAVAIFQLASDEVLGVKGLVGCVAYQNDILLFVVIEAALRKDTMRSKNGWQ